MDIDEILGVSRCVNLANKSAIYVWGYNQSGQTGRRGKEGSLRIPKQLPPELFGCPAAGNSRWLDIACGREHTAAVASDGSLFTWGYSPSFLWCCSCCCSIRRRVTASLGYTWGLGSMGQLGHCSLQSGDKELLPRRVVSLDGIFIKEVACGGVHSCAVTAKGALYAWGGGQAGQLGVGPLNGFFSCKLNESEMMLRNIPVLVVPDGVQLVACGHSHTLISANDGRIHGWGYNCYGQAANEKSTYAWYPSPVDWCVGEVRKLAAGGGHSAVLTDACSLKELCEFRLAETVNLSNASEVEDVASRTGSDALARLCERLREHYYNDDEFGL